MPAILLALLAMLALGACGTPPRPPEPLPEPPVVKLEQDLLAEADEELFPRDVRIEYARLRPGDNVLMMIAGDPQFEAGVSRTVDPLGRVPVPLAGPIQAEGMLPEEFAAEVTSALAAFYTVPPQTEVIVLTPSPREALIMGAVNSQGAIALNPDDTLLAVIAKAAGVVETPRQGGAETNGALGGRPIWPNEARIIRDGGERVALVDLKPLLTGVAPKSDVAIAPGDIIQIAPPDLATILVFGEVESPGPIVLEEGMDLMQVLALAGGPTEDASYANAVIVRNWWVAGGAEIIPCNLRQTMYKKGFQMPVPRDRDLFIVPRSGIASLNYILRQITPSLLTVVTAQAILD